MTPDSPQERIGRLEQEMAATRQRAEDQSRRIENLHRHYEGLMPLVVSHAEMRIQIDAALTEARAARQELQSLEEKLDRREAEVVRERKKDRQWLVGTVLVAAMLIVAAIGLMVG
jgi:hypothetical protein